MRNVANCFIVFAPNIMDIYVHMVIEYLQITEIKLFDDDFIIEFLRGTLSKSC